MEQKYCESQAKETTRCRWGKTLLRRGGDSILREVYGQIAQAPQQP
jgi:hypothetical protein